MAGQPMWAAIEDAGRLRDALGVALPVGIPEAFTEPLPDPLGDLVARWARTHGPFTAADVAARYGLGVAVVGDGAAAARPPTGGSPRASSSPRSTAPSGATARCCACCGDAAWPGCARRWSRCRPPCSAGSCPPGTGSRSRRPAAGDGRGRGSGPGAGGGGWRRRADAGAVLEAIERLAGAPVPASALETLVLPGRVPGYSPALLDELTSAGEVVWAGAGTVGSGDGWLVLAPAESAPLLLPEPGELTMTPLHGAVLTALAGGGGMFFRMLGDRVARVLTATRRTTATSWRRCGTWSGRGWSPTTRWRRCAWSRPAGPPPGGRPRPGGRHRYRSARAGAASRRRPRPGCSTPGRPAGDRRLRRPVGRPRRRVRRSGPAAGDAVADRAAHGQRPLVAAARAARRARRRRYRSWR